MENMIIRFYTNLFIKRSAAIIKEIVNTDILKLMFILSLLFF